MDKILLVIRHAFVSFIGSLFIAGLGFFLKLFLVRNLIDAAFSFGVFALGISMIDFLSPFFLIGFGGAIPKYLPKWNVNNSISKINNFITFIGLFSFILSCLCVL